MKVREQFEGISTVFFFDIRGKTVQLLADQGEDDKSGIFESTAEVSEKTSAE